MCGRNWLEETGRSARTRHETEDQVGTTLSFARAECLLGREYHGRFLIELLQNAADAWRADRRSQNGARSRLAVRIIDGAVGPVLVVANQGIGMTAKVAVSSLGQIGASTKPEGEAIGHKGIGFKSVLEITRRPQIFSGLKQGENPRLALAFDPDKALEGITNTSPNWSEWVHEIGGVNRDDPLAAIPVLRFPHWVDNLPPDVMELTAAGFDTVVRLPFDPHDEKRLATDRNAWLSKAREAIEGLSDEIFILLGCFGEICIEDRLARDVELIVPQSKPLEPEIPNRTGIY